MPSRDIHDCRPELVSLWVDISTLWAETYPDLPQPFLICTYRSNDEQDALYAQGRTTPGHIVTNAKAGQSPHNTVPSSAIDIGFLTKDKHLDWGLENYTLLNRLIEKRFPAVRWGGGFQKLKDYDHWELRDWKEYRDTQMIKDALV